MRKRFTSVACATALVLAGSAAGAAPASASAFGCQYIGGFGFTFKGFELRAPKGWLCHQIRGSGRRIDSESAIYGPAYSMYGTLKGRVCNWRIDFAYRRASDGSEYRRDRGRTRHRCNYHVKRTVTTRKVLEHYGTACAELYVNGVRRSQQCHNITR
jgi:hypothetical protein